LAKAVVDPP